METQYQKDSEVLNDALMQARKDKQDAPITANAVEDELLHPRAPMDSVAIDLHLINASPTIAQFKNPSQPNPKTCVVYQVARPILVLLEGILFFKPKWREALKILVAALDAEFPTATNGQ